MKEYKTEETDSDPCVANTVYLQSGRWMYLASVENPTRSLTLALPMGFQRKCSLSLENYTWYLETEKQKQRQ